MNKEYILVLENTLKQEFETNYRNGIYGLTQRIMTYNSNRIEGSTLSEAQTANLFETGSVYSKDEFFRSKDIEDANGHFQMFNLMLKTTYLELTEDLIKTYQKKLKENSFEYLANGHIAGEYKTKKNFVGKINTSLPENVESNLKNLLKEYSCCLNKQLEEIATFHVKFEAIHPFADGNGRVGRLILFKECLKNNIPPFIIRDENKLKYYEGLSYYDEHADTTLLVNLFKEEQEYYYNLSHGFLFDYIKK